MLARTAAARSAVAAYAARPAIPVRCAPETEKTVFARLNGRPSDEDMVAVFATGIDKQYKDRWDLVRRGVILPLAESVVVRNELPEADVESATKRQPAKSSKVFANPRADILLDAKTACTVDFTTKKKVYFFDTFAVGVAKFARVKVDFVTDDAALANSLRQVLAKAPKSSIPRYHQAESTGVLLHSSTKDEQAGGLDAYVMYDAKLAVARGALSSVTPILDAFAFMAASRLATSEVLVVRGDIQRDTKSGVVSLILGESTASEGIESQGTKFAAWGAPGATRLFDGVPSDKDLSSKPVPPTARSLLAPQRIVFAIKKDGKAKPMDAEGAKKLFLEKFSLGPADKAGPVFDKLIQAGKIELLQLE